MSDVISIPASPPEFIIPVNHTLYTALFLMWLENIHQQQIMKNVPKTKA
ncbi:hypothetical protein [Paenibacillus chibensis]|nr:hypothetical protein [Paenibacillus chibensis]MEC0373449.1 hypothetical protein [Paenibacillus chibensis]